MLSCPTRRTFRDHGTTCIVSVSELRTGTTTFARAATAGRMRSSRRLISMRSVIQRPTSSRTLMTRGLTHAYTLVRDSREYSRLPLQER